MKRGTPDHPKTKQLMKRLGCERLLAIGLLEQLWHFTAEFCPDGDLSKYDPDQLAESIDWRGRGDDLVDALITTGWLDAHAGRIRVHDWAEHADDAIHMKLARARRRFADGSVPRLKRLPLRERDEASHFYYENRELFGTREAHEINTPCARNTHGGMPAPPEPEPRQSQSPAPPEPEPASGRETAEVEQQHTPELPPVRAPQPPREQRTQRKRAVAAWLEPIRQALAEAVGSPPDEPLVEQLAHEAAMLGGHPFAVARWVWETARDYGQPIRKHGFFAMVLPEDFGRWLERQRGPDLRREVISRQACQCGSSEVIQFADCIVSHPCDRRQRGGLQRAGDAIPAASRDG